MRVRLTLLAFILIGAAVYGGTHYVHRTAADTLAAAPITTPARSGSMNYGVAAGNLVSASPSELNQRLTTMENLGVGWVRFDFRWSVIQPKNASTYDWTATDRVVQAATAHHLKVLGTIDSTPGWASVADCNSTDCQPASSAAFGRFSGAVAAHYAPMGVHDWEIWNEENSVKFWLPEPNAAIYAQILTTSSTAIRATDPLSFILVGGLARVNPSSPNITPTTFVADLYRDNAAHSFDGIASHPYAFPQLPNASDPQEPFALRKIMISNGDSTKPIWITEIGAPTNGPDNSHVTEVFQAQTATTAAELYNQVWLGPLFWYTDTDASSAPTTNENFFGLVSADNSPKPAYNTLKALIAGNR